MSWLDIDWNAWNAVAATVNALATTVGAAATCTLVFVGYGQVRQLRREAQIERTLKICNKYDSGKVNKITMKLAKAKDNNDFYANSEKYRNDVISLLNYLDTIAIGIAQGLYAEDIAREHMEAILILHHDEYLTVESAKQIDIDRRDFKRLSLLYNKWTNSIQ